MERAISEKSPLATYTLVTFNPWVVAYIFAAAAVACVVIWHPSLSTSTALLLVYLFAILTFVLSNALFLSPPAPSEPQ